MPATFKNLAWWRCRWTMPGSSDLCLSDEKRRWRTCCATRGAKTTRVGKSRYSSFTSSYRVLRLSVGRNCRAVPIARLFKIAQF